MTTWCSSYEENNYGDLFYSLVRIYRPKKIVELGTKAGYSAYHMARALRDNGTGTLDCYDLFEKFVEYSGIRSTDKQTAKENLSGFKNIVNIELANAIGVNKKYREVDILHVDLENNDRVLEKVIPAWINKVNKLIIIEGGSKQRDELDLSQDLLKMPAHDWLNSSRKNQEKSLKKILPNIKDEIGQFVVVGGASKYKNSHISDWLRNFSKKQQGIEYFTFEPYPSLTIIRKI